MRYVIWSRVIYYLVGENSIWDLSEKIKNGNIVTELIKPVDYFKYNYMLQLASQIARTVCVGIPLLLIAYIIRPISVSVIQIIVCLFSIVLSITICFSFDYIMSLVSIYTQNTWGVSALREGLFQILSGSFIPLSLYGTQIKQFIYFFPFAYVIDVPTNILLGNANGYKIVLQLLYVFFMIIIVELIQKKVWNKLQIQGG